MRTFSLSLLKEQALRGRMQELNIREEDIEESFVRSGGKGGQHVNKVSTGVYLKHLPTGIEVKCRQERSQALNRYHARVILVEKIERMRREIAGEERRKREKLRRQRRKRPAKAKETMLAEKKRLSEKKRLRSSRFEL